jgi:hypothetical protein
MTTPQKARELVERLREVRKGVRSPSYVDVCVMLEAADMIEALLATPQDKAGEMLEVIDRVFVADLSARLVCAYRKHGGIAKIARAANGAMAIRNIAVFEAVDAARAALGMGEKGS